MHVLPPVPASPPAHVARITVPALGIDSPVREGVALRVLSVGAGHYRDTAWPGMNRAVAFAAHNVTPVNGKPYGPFHKLQGARKGMKIVVRYSGHRYVYRISGQRVVRPTSVGFLFHGPGKLVLTNCFPDHSIAYRLVTFAWRVR